MSTLPIRMLGDPVLRVPAEPLSLEALRDPETQARIDTLIATMKAANGAGIAAPQVGWSAAVCVVHVEKNPRYPYKPDYPLTVFVNPQLTVTDPSTELLYEGCLSVPNLRGLVPRAMGVHIDALDRHGNPLSVDAVGLTAGTFQHEFDHLEGKLFVDRVQDPTTLCTWETFDLFYRADFVARATALNKKYL